MENVRGMLEICLKFTLCNFASIVSLLKVL